MAKLGTIGAGTVPTAAEWNSGFAAWVSSSPTYSGITIGNGIVVSKYTQLGRTTFFKWRLTFGTTTTVTGWPNVSLPVAAADANEFQGIAQFTDSSASKTYIATATFTAANVGPVYINPAAADTAFVFVSSTAPFTWATSDTLAMYITYEGAT